MRNFLSKVPGIFVVLFFVTGGLFAGLVIYTTYMSKAFSYLSDKPDACVNCHIMTPYFQSWSHSSHALVATCNDCHVPHDNVFAKYAFKAKDGLYHSYVFTMREEPQVIRPREESNEVIMQNCIRCHTQLNTEFVKTGMISYVDAKNGKGKVCWDCHTQVPHTNISNLASSPNAIVPLPESPVPKWLKDIL